MRERLAVTASICAMAALICASDQVIASCRHALTLCCELIIPSLFPFFLLSILLSRLGLPMLLGKLLSPASNLLFGVSGAGCTALLMGLCGGYPLGAAYIADMHSQGRIGKEEAEQLLGFCNNSGPAFIVGAIGTGVFHSVKAGLFLYSIHALSAMLCGIIMRCKSPETKQPEQVHRQQPFPIAVTEAVKQAVVSVLNVCGFVVCFSVLTGLLEADGLISRLCGVLSYTSGTELHWTSSLLVGFLEIGSGIGLMRGLRLSPLNLALAAFLMGWGGVSVHFQTMAVISDSGLSGRAHLTGRMLNAGISTALAYFLSGVVFS